jgi:iron complex outermembrane recepter protein
MRFITRLLISTVLVSVASLSLNANAQEEQSEQQTAEADDFHNNDIVVLGPYGKQLDILAGTSAITGETLATDARGQIGDTLTQLPGVSSTSFAPGASRPVLRGFQGGRVAVLTDGIGNIDASNTSADHAVTIESLTADRIEVLRGPAVLLYGGQAVGGAVNIVDKRIPRKVPDEPVHVDALLGYASANQEYSGGASLDVPLTSRFVVHVDGSYRKGKDQRSGGFVLSPALRAETLAFANASSDPEESESLRALSSSRGKVPGTAVKTWTAGVGASFIDDGGNLGISYSIYDTLYGIASRPGGEERVSIDLKQYRFDMRGEVNLGDGLFDKVKLRSGYANYRHQEIVAGEIGTLFLSKGIETRAELVQNEKNGWNGASGLQFQTRDFEAIGEEAFVPPNKTNQFGIFTLQEFALGKITLQGSARYDRASLRALSLDTKRTFNNVSAALGLAYSDGLFKVGANSSRTARAPSAEELFSNGPHLATQAFEIGDANLKSERSWNGELYVRYDSTPFELSATLHANRFSNFIYERETGNTEDDLPVFQITQSKARFWGVELEASARIGSFAGFDLETDIVSDYVRAKFGNNGGNVPRIPPLRVLGGIGLKSDSIDLRGEVEWADNQNRTEFSETTTKGYTVTNASATFRPWGRNRNIALIASANNIFDVTVRRAASFTKDFAPLAGRDFRVTARFSF